MFLNSTLIENFNSTKESRPYFLRHENYVTDIKEPTCGWVQALPYNERCHYVSTTEQCDDDVYIFNYIRFFYCAIDTSSLTLVLLGITAMLCICGTLFIILGSTADGFFCPSLKVLSVMMGLNENVAGVTLLAFGNCAPDMITNIAGLNSESRRIYSDVFGAAIFVVFIVAGSIITFIPFIATPSNFLRDCCFLTLSVVYTDYALQTDSSINVWEAGVILVMYVFYIIVVVVDQYLLVKTVKVLQEMSDEEFERYSVEYYNQLTTEAHFEIISRNSRFSTAFIEEPMPFNIPHGPNHLLFKQVYLCLIPIDMEDWQENGRAMKAFMIFKSPIVVVLRLLIPVVDFELDDQGWIKLLNCIQLTTLPVFILWATLPDMKPYGMPLWQLSPFVTVPLSILLFFYSRTDTTPKCYKYMSILACFGSVYVIYGCAAETISILNCLGISTHRTNSFLGCTVLGWGNSVGDAVANLALARQGYEKMGFAACFGGPIFNSLVGLGIGMLYKAYISPDLKTDKMTVAEGTMGANVTVFMIIGLLCLLLAANMTNFIMRRSIGIFMIMLYCMFFLFTFMSELELIHPYGSEHRLDMRVEPE